jgi:hypothetical protein
MATNTEPNKIILPALLPVQHVRSAMKFASLTVPAAAIAMLLLVATVGCRSNKQRTTQESAATLRRGFATGIQARARVMDAYRQMGKWPGTNQEANLPLPETYATATMSDLTISTGGVITLRFKPEGTMRLLPDARHTPIGTRWRCVTTGFENVTAVVPCRPAY